LRDFSCCSEISYRGRAPSHGSRRRCESRLAARADTQTIVEAGCCARMSCGAVRVCGNLNRIQPLSRARPSPRPPIPAVVPADAASAPWAAPSVSPSAVGSPVPAAALRSSPRPPPLVGAPFRTRYRRCRRPLSQPDGGSATISRIRAALLATLIAGTIFEVSPSCFGGRRGDSATIRHETVPTGTRF
jgi:hypothetical protein